jgi:malic enzyme
MYNKGTAFSHEERRAFGLAGLLPAAVSSMEQQAARVYANISRKKEPLERYIGLAALQDRNETLFHRVLLDHLEEFLPIVSTPTVAEACRSFSHIFRRARGIWITPGHRGQIEEVLGDAPFEDVRLVVVTDNERMLGIGDQGAGGMGLSIGKLAVYTAAGIHPAATLPVSLDFGTGNRALLDDDLYLGWRHERLRGEEYDSLVEEFVQAVSRRFPRAILQWEDFDQDVAFRVLARHRRALCSFSDDIQGVAATALSGVLAASRATGTAFVDARIAVVGAGVAGVGVARLLRDSLRRAGLSVAEARAAVAVLDSRGLIVDDVALTVRDEKKRELAWPAELAHELGLPVGARDLASLVHAFRPTVLIGASGQPGLFTRSIVRAMAAQVEWPVFLMLSQPESRNEAAAGEILAWTKSRAFVATSSQATSAFVSPGVVLGALVAEARQLSDGMFAAAAAQVAEQVLQETLAVGGLYPAIRELRRVAARVAEAVVRQAREEGLGRPIPDAAIPAEVAGAMWEPRYLALAAPAHAREESVLAARGALR